MYDRTKQSSSPRAFLGDANRPLLHQKIRRSVANCNDRVPRCLDCYSPLIGAVLNVAGAMDAITALFCALSLFCFAVVAKKIKDLLAPHFPEKAKAPATITYYTTLYMMAVLD